MGYRLPDIDRLDGQRLERRIVVCRRRGFLGLGRAIAQAEALTDAARDGVERDDAFLREVRRERGRQEDRPGRLTDELYFGLQPVERDQPESPRQRLAFARRSGNTLAEWLAAEPMTAAPAA